MTTASSARARGPARRAPAVLGLLLLALGCGPQRLEPGLVMRPVHRFVDDAVADQGPLTLDMPHASVRDETRNVLRAPLRLTILWPQDLEDRTGNRLWQRSQILPPEFREARAILSLPEVKVGSHSLELPAERVPVKRQPEWSSVALEVPIPANPDRARVVVTVQAYAIGLVDLGDVRTPEVAIPAGARLEFGFAVVEPDAGWDPVEFAVESCRQDDCERIFEERFDPKGREGPRWRDRRVSLEHLAGQTRRFRFTARQLSEQAPFSFPVWSNPTIYAPAPLGPGERNTILLSVDTLRADHLTSYGYHRDTAPFVDARFARGGTLFEHPVAAATITTPSHASMFTSLPPVTHGTIHGLKLLPKNIPTLAEWARQGGVETAAVTEDGWLGVRHGFGRGFESFIENKSADIMEPEGQVDVTFAQARRWLERNRDKHFFLFLHTFQVHTPYAPPARYAGLFTDDEAPAGQTTPSRLRWMADYDREIRYTDDELGRLFETIDALGLDRDTVFILTSDHGEAFLEHGYLEHGNRLDEEAVRVPLLFWGRDIPAGRRVAAPVAHVDLMPTILELLGLPLPGNLSGRSLLPLIEGSGSAEAFEKRPLYSEARGTIAIGPERQAEPFLPPAFGVRLGDRKLERYRTPDGGYRYEYYHVETDPGEKSNLYPEHPEQAQDLRKLVDGYEARGRAERERIDAGHPPKSEEIFLDPRQEEKLRALGYLQ